MKLKTKTNRYPKRLISLLAAAAMVISLFQFGMPAFAVEVAIHDSFEVSFDGWINDLDTLSELSADEGAGVDGSRALKLSNRQDSDDSVRSQKGLYLWGGEKYSYSIYVRHEEPQAEEFSWLSVGFIMMKIIVRIPG